MDLVTNPSNPATTSATARCCAPMTSRRILGIEACERGRPHRIAEHHGQLPAFGIGRSPCIGDTGATAAVGTSAPSAAMASSQPRAMADQADAKIPQILGHQARPARCCGSRCRGTSLVLSEPEAAQPRHYVHAAILGPEERQSLMKGDIPLPFGPTAAAPKYVPSRV